MTNHFFFLVCHVKTIDFEIDIWVDAILQLILTPEVISDRS